MDHRYKAIGFDWSGVLFFPTMKYSEAVQAFLNISQEEFRRIYFKHNHLLNIGNQSPKTVWTKIFSEIGREAEVDEFLIFLDNMPPGKINDDMIAFIKSLKKKGIKTGLFSNNTTDGAEQMRSFGLNYLFDTVLFSAEVGFMKPDPRVFQLLARELQVDVSELIFVDDGERSLEGAEKIGYTPILYKDMEGFRKEIGTLGII